MSYNILGINPFHNGSVCVLSDGEIIFYLEEERLTRIKYDELPLKSILYILDNYDINDIAIAGINVRKIKTLFFEKEINSYFLKKFKFSDKNIYYFDSTHHKTHAAISFYNSGFKEAIGIVIDAGGSIYQKGKKDFIEQDTIFACSYPFNFSPIFKNSISVSNKLKQNPLGIGRSFEWLSKQFGFGALDGGKIMGLSSYGKKNKKYSNIFYKNNTNINIVNSKNLFNNFFSKNYSTEWHFNQNVITDLEKDLSYQVQNSTQEILGNYIEKAIKVTKLNKIIIAGGYGLNCVANYYFKKRFPDVEFYFEPIAHDGGTAIGAAKLLYHQKTQDKTIKPQKTLYYGPKYTKEQILKGIQKYLD